MSDQLDNIATDLKGKCGYSEQLSLDEYSRYGRQLLVPEVGIIGQHKLKNAKVLVVGAGGLGSPALAYLSGAGIGEIGIVDGDTVDTSNLHRQIIHTTGNLGISKVESAKEFCLKLNPNCVIRTYPVRLECQNSFEIFQNYDLILDCTDAPAVRYLINDTAVLLGKPVVSASALKTEGQLSIFNFENGPCYRCFYPIPPPSDSVLSCGDGGIVGPVVGVMGVMQATEAIKVLCDTYKDRFKPFLLLYSAFSVESPWKYFKMRGKSKKCRVCGPTSDISKKDIESGTIDYAAFCGRSTPFALSSGNRIDVKEYAKLSVKHHVLIDVRPREQFDICSLPGSINIPLSELRDKQYEQLESFQTPIYVICRYGNDSQLAVDLIKKSREEKSKLEVFDIIGGLQQWSIQIDNSFPIY